MSEIQRKDSGTWGKCVWVLTEENYLVIGQGMAEECFASDVPWRKYIDQIAAIIFRGEVKVPKGFSMKNFFSGYKNLKQIDMRELDTEGVVSMQSMFAGCDKLQFVDMAGRNTSGVISMSKMFQDCKSLNYVNMAGIDTSNVTGMSQMFASCKSLKEVNFSGIDTSNVANMLGMFMNCGSLEKIDLSGFDTSSVTDMSIMFSNCANLEEIDITSFNTENVQDMSNMFLFCRNLKHLYADGIDTRNVKSMANMFAHCKQLNSLNLSSFDTRNTEDMTGMFASCESLKYGNLGPNCVIEGKDTEWPLETSTGEVYCAEEVEFDLHFDPNGGKAEKGHVIFRSLAGADNDVIDNCFIPPEEKVFKEWNTNRFGMGKSYKPGDTTGPIYGDTKLYAIWAGRPILSATEALDTVPYGQKLPFKEPEINCNYSDITNIEVQISRDGVTNWETIDRDTIFPVSSNGSFLRYIVYNKVGKTISDTQKISICKADYDLSKVYWKTPEESKYDGTEKKVELANLPDSIKPSYYGNTAVDAGTYTTSAIFDYDSLNYNQPPGAEDFVWEIEKADFDMFGVNWNYTDAFTYDGSEKVVELTKIPNGATVNYVGNTSQVAGNFRATAELLYEKNNYNPPRIIEPLEWEVKCGEYDMSQVSWDYDKQYVFDGEEKTVELRNVPEDLIVTYKENKMRDAGEYISVATFTPKNALNMNAPKNMVLKWTIAKADFDISGVTLGYSGPIDYDETVQEVKLLNVPEGLTYELYGNVGINVGKYEAKAVFKPVDLLNYNVPESISIPWEIQKIDYDFEKVRWNVEQQFVYNGEVRRVSLINLPTSITAEYENNEAVDCGEYSATVILHNNNPNYNDISFNGCDWQIVKANCKMQEVCWDYTQAYVFDGSEKTVRLTGLPENVSVSYSGNVGVDASEYEAVAEFTVSDPKNYNVPKAMTLPWQITKGNLDMSMVTWSYDEALVYDGTAKTITLNNLPVETTVTYANNSNIDAGKYNAKATFAVEEEGNYICPESMSLEWIIKRATFDMSNVSWDVGGAGEYDGNVHKVELKGVPKGATPVYTDNTGMNAATYIASAEFEYDEKNYNKPQVKDCEWEIKKTVYQPGNVAWDYADPFTYDGTVKKIAITGLKDDAEVTYINCEAKEAGSYHGEARISSKDKGNFIDPEVIKCSWEIKKAVIDMSTVKWSYNEPLVYNGMQRQIVLSGIPDGVLVKYEGNEHTGAGEYTARAVFAAKDRNNFISPEPMECKWEIRRADLDMANVRWDYTKPLVFNGEVQKVSLTNLPQGLMATYTGNEGRGTGKYEAIAEFELKDKENYNLPSINNLRWEIQKTDFDMSRVSWNYRQPLVYNSDVQKVSLENVPEGLIAVFEGNEATDVGKYEAKVSFRPQDEANYNIPESRHTRWEIIKADIDVSDVNWTFEPGLFVYDGSLKTVLLKNVPDGLKVKYNGNMETKAGDYVAEVSFELKDKNNYNTPSVRSCIWKIEKANHDLSGVRWSYDSDFVYDGEPKSVSLLDIPTGVSAVYTDNEKTDAGQYTAKAEFLVDRTNYNVPEAMTLSWKIDKAETEVIGATWGNNREFVYDGKAKVIELTGLDSNLRVTYKDNRQIDVGEYVAEATVIRTDTKNYRETKVDGCQWKIEKADINMTNVKWDYNESFVYDGSDKKVELLNVPSTVKAIYEENTAVNAGRYKAVARFQVDKNNFNTPDPIECAWEIQKAPIDTGKIQWDYSEDLIYDGKTKSISLLETNGSKGLFGWKKAAGKPVEYVGLPAGSTVTYEANSAIEPGNYIAKATIRPADEENYILETVVSRAWSIIKQDNGGHE